MEKEYIICAAIKLKEPRKLSTTYSDLSICEIGYRHCDIYERFEGIVSRKPSDQGFFTSNGRFVNRREAMKIAYNANQLKDSVIHYSKITIKETPSKIWNELYSEDLY